MRGAMRVAEKAPGEPSERGPRRSECALDGFHEGALVDGRRRSVPKGRQGSCGALPREAFVRKQRGGRLAPSL